MSDMIRADEVLVGAIAEQWVNAVDKSILPQMRKRLDQVPLEDEMVNRLIREAFRRDPDAFALIILERDEASGEKVIVRMYFDVQQGSKMAQAIYDEIEEISGAPFAYERE